MERPASSIVQYAEAALFPTAPRMVPRLPIEDVDVCVAHTPGSLALPQDTPRLERLQLRASWEHVESRMRDRPKVERGVREAIASVEGVQDEVLADMILRHFTRCQPAEEVRPAELANLLATLVGVERAMDIVRASLAVLEEGRKESWYEANLRRRYG